MGKGLPSADHLLYSAAGRFSQYHRRRKRSSTEYKKEQPALSVNQIREIPQTHRRRT